MTQEPYHRPQDESESHRTESRLTAAAKCLVVGIGVGSVGIPLCFLGALFFFMLRDLGILFLL